MRLPTIILMLALLTSATAHELLLFASYDGETVSGQAYVRGGGSLPGQAVTIHNAAGRPLATVTTDDQGSFAWTPTAPGIYHLVAQSPDGHRATAKVDAAALGDNVEVPELRFLPTTPPAALADTPTTSPPAMTKAEISALVSKAVEQQIRPLREQLMQLEHRTRLTDVIGGIGYIFGLMGLLLWYRGARRRPPAAPGASAE